MELGKYFSLIMRYLEFSFLLPYFGQEESLGFMQLLEMLAAVMISYFLGGEHTSIMLGLYGYNAILTIIAVSAFLIVNIIAMHL